MPFVAFPHQINDPIKLRNVLLTIDELLRSGQPITDENLGYAIFLKGIIKERNPSGLSLEEQLNEIKKKPKSDQSPLTIARDIRRLFLWCGFIENTPGGRSKITPRGEMIINARSESGITIEEKKAWLQGIQSIALQQRGISSSFRPLKIMLEMLAGGPIDTKMLTFAFTAADESDIEIERIKRVVGRASIGPTQFSEELIRAGISPSSARDSVKILPALAERVGLIERGGGITKLTTYGRTLLDEQDRIGPPLPTPPRARRRKPFFRIITTDDELRRNWKPADTEKGEVDYDPRDETERLNHLRERTDEHQETLIMLRHIYDGKGWRTIIGNFDFLAEKDAVALLQEVKTLIEGDITDERLRIIDGIGKLMLYEALEVPHLLKNKSAIIQKILVFSRKPTSQDHVDFLTRIGIWVLWFTEEGRIDGEPTALTEFRRLTAL